MFLIMNFKEGSNVELEELLQQIRDGVYAEQVSMIRNLNDSLQPENITRSLLLYDHLPKFFPAGEFKLVNRHLVITDYSKLVVMEFTVDTNDALEPLKQQIEGIPFTYACFRNANNNGMVVFVKADTEFKPQSHSWAHYVVRTHYQRIVGFSPFFIGESFLDSFEVSYAPDLFVNDTAPVFTTSMGNIDLNFTRFFSLDINTTI